MPEPAVSLPNQGLVTSTTPASLVLTLNYALPWQLIVKNESGGDVTAVRVRARTHEKGPWAPWEGVKAGLPVAAGSTLSLTEIHLPSQAIEVELTAASAGVATLWLVGA